MYEKHSYSNRAFYGPSVSAPESYRRLSRGAGCCFDCRNGCLFSIIFKFILTGLSIVGIAVFLFWLIVRPKFLKFHITDASLTEFNYTASNNTLHYNLTLNIIVRNPNKKISVYYDYIEARVLYQKTRFDMYSFGPLYQDHKTTNMLKHVFKGQHLVALNAKQTNVLNKENNLGVYGINVKMYLKIRLHLRMYGTMKLKPKVSCRLHVPFKSSSGGSYFEATKCDWSLWSPY